MRAGGRRARAGGGSSRGRCASAPDDRERVCSTPEPTRIQADASASKALRTAVAPWSRRTSVARDGIPRHLCFLRMGDVGAPSTAATADGHTGRRAAASPHSLGTAASFARTQLSDGAQSRASATTEHSRHSARSRERSVAVRGYLLAPPECDACTRWPPSEAHAVGYRRTLRRSSRARRTHATHAIDTRTRRSRATHARDARDPPSVLHPARAHRRARDRTASPRRGCA